MEDDQLLAPFERMLGQVFPPSKVREIERGGAWREPWSELEESGYLNALVPETAGGAGLTLPELAPLLLALGGHVVPLPVAETMVARALLAEAGGPRLTGPLALATGSAKVTFARVSDAVLYDDGQVLKLLHPDAFSIEADEPDSGVNARLNVGHDEGQEVAPRPTGGLRPISALLRAGGIAGATDRVLAMTVRYAGERAQFGKPIASRQAVQQQMALMAEHAVAARLAFELGCASGFPPQVLACAAAKSVGGAAAAQVAGIAHAVHGAIGISSEHDLQLFTRALHAWRLAEGSESYWNRMIGADALGACNDSIDWVRENISR